MGARVYVGNLPPTMVERDLEAEFNRFGTLRSVWVARKPPGFAFIEFDDRRDADDAIRKLDGFQGWRVELARAPDRGPPGGRGGGPPGGYGGGYGRGGGYGGGGYGGGGYDRDRSPPRYGRSSYRDRSPPPARRRSPSYEPVRRRSPSYSPRPRRSPSYGRSRSPVRRSRSRS